MTIQSHYLCPYCGTTGRFAHTLRYCPFARAGSSVVKSLKTSRDSAINAWGAYQKLYTIFMAYTFYTFYLLLLLASQWILITVEIATE